MRGLNQFGVEGFTNFKKGSHTIPGLGGREKAAFSTGEEKAVGIRQRP